MKYKLQHISTINRGSRFRSEVLVLLCMLLTGCGGGRGGSGPAATARPGVTGAHALKFTIPKPPTAIGDPREQAVWVAEHFWNGFDFADTTALAASPDVVEQAFADFIHIIGQLDRETASRAIVTMLSRVEQYGDPGLSAWYHFTELYEKYLYDPNSPTRNEEIYITVLESTLGAQLPDEYKLRARYQMEQAQKNRPGSVAMDFTYVPLDGGVRRMHSIHAENLLLWFYDPDCTDCGRVRAGLETSPVIGRLTDTGLLEILAVSTQKEIEKWRAYASVLPREWHSGQNMYIQEDSLYDLRAIPSLYLLDRDKRVVLKDATLDQIEHHLQTASL